jgi:hypothetical protein
MLAEKVAALQTMRSSGLTAGGESGERIHRGRARRIEAVYGAIVERPSSAERFGPARDRA